MFVHLSRNVPLLHSLKPAYVVIVSFAAERAGIIRLFDLLPLVENVAFLHHGDIVAFSRGSQPLMIWSTSSQTLKFSQRELIPIGRQHDHFTPQNNSR